MGDVVGTVAENLRTEGRPDEIRDWHELVRQYPEIPDKYHPQHPAVVAADNIDPVEDISIEERVDLRELSTVTIDPDYAHDHDDAISIREEEDGFRAWVHIADVAHYVPEGSAIDKEARNRGVTFYLGDNTRHMLPRRLAQDICSLSPGMDRAAFTVEMEMDESGGVQGYDVYRSVIESDAHLTYTHADALIDGSEEVLDWYKSENADTDTAWFQEICDGMKGFESVTTALRKDRWDQSLILNKRQSASSRVVEELMISANLVVGDYLRKEGAGMYRFEEAADAGWVNEVASDLAKMGYQTPEGLRNDPRRALNNFFDEVVDEEDESLAKKTVVTKLPRARYVEASEYNPAPHFGLGMEDYAHFTSPIRRYTDLVNHRIIAGTCEENKDTLSGIASYTSAQQGAADEAAMAWYDANT